MAPKSRASGQRMKLCLGSETSWKLSTKMEDASCRILKVLEMVFNVLEANLTQSWLGKFNASELRFNCCPTVTAESLREANDVAYGRISTLV